MKFIKILFYNVIIIASLASCSVYTRSPTKTSLIQPSIVTTSSFEKDGDNLRNYHHDISMAQEASKRSTAEASRRATAKTNKAWGFEPNYSYLYKSKVLGNNDYYIENDKIYAIEKQNDSQNCWAACLQYMLMVKFGKTVSQQTLISIIKGDPYSNNATSIDDILKLMGFGRMKISQNGAEHLVTALAENQPVMIGTMKEGDKFGHARLIVGARYSFHVRAFCKKTLTNNAGAYC